METSTNIQNKRKRGAASSDVQKTATRSNPPRSAAMNPSVAATYDDSNTDSKSEKTKKTKKPRKNCATLSKKPFRFLDLPAELRNNIYDIILGSSSITLRRTARRRKATKGEHEAPNWQDSIVVKSPLTQVNKQVCAEFFHAVAISATIQATVLGFDFGHIITFLNRLSDGMLNKMKAREEDETPKRLFTITLKHIGQRMHSDDNLRRWLNRMEVSEKKGTNIDFHYTCAPFRRPQDRDWHHPRPIYNSAPHYTEGSRGAAERAEILSAAANGDSW